MFLCYNHYKYVVWGDYMSKVGFRRELLGFNREDVIEYIRKIQKDSGSKEQELISSLETLNARNAELIDELKKIPMLEAELEINKATIEKLAKQVSEFEAIREETENVSQDIAKMYLVAKSNAEAINTSTKESSERAFYEIQNTLNTIKSVLDKLETAKANVISTSEKYTNEIEALVSSFKTSEETINNISAEIDEKVKV